jgi:hypothetical protein
MNDEAERYDENTGGGGAREGSQARAAMQGLKQQASRGIDEAKHAAGEFVARKQSAVAGQVGQMSGAVNAAADKLEQDGGSGHVATLFREAARGIDSFAASLDDKSPREMWQAVEDLARRQPVAFVAGATLLGFVVGRFVRAAGDGDGSAAHPKTPSEGSATDRGTPSGGSMATGPEGAEASAPPMPAGVY